MVLAHGGALPLAFAGVYGNVDGAPLRRACVADLQQ